MALGTVVLLAAVDSNATILSLDCQPFGYRLATSCEDASIRLWDLSLFAPLISPNAHTTDTLADRVRLEHREPLLQGSANVPPPLAKLSHHNGAANVVRWSPCGTLLASGGADGIVVVWQILVTGGSENEKWSVAREHHLHAADILDVAWSPDLENVASCSVDNKLIVFNVKTLSNLSVPLTEIVKGLAWDPLGELLAGERDGGAGVIVWRARKEPSLVLDVAREVKEPYSRYLFPTQFRRFK